MTRDPPMTPLGLLIDGLAAYRLTRLVTVDTLLDRQRDAIIRRAYRRAGRERIEQPMPDVPGAWAEVARTDDDPPKLAALISCHYCSGLWIAAAVVVARHLWPRRWEPVAEVLAVAALAAVVAAIAD